jgi:hypothetical protein
MLRGRRRGLLSWVSLSVLAVVCGLLGFLQYRWIGEVSLAERDRLLSNLRSSLDRMNRDFNAEVAMEYRSIVPSGPEALSGDVTAVLAGNIVRWRASSRRPKVFRRIGLADAASGEPALHLFKEADGSSLRLCGPTHGPACVIGWRRVDPGRRSPAAFRRAPRARTTGW